MLMSAIQKLVASASLHMEQLAVFAVLILAMFTAKLQKATFTFIIYTPLQKAKLSTTSILSKT